MFKKIRKTSKFTMAAAMLVTMSLATGLFAYADQSTGMGQGRDWGPKWTADGNLRLPEGYHEWVYLQGDRRVARGHDHVQGIAARA